MSHTRTILFAGGGTGGHLYPNLAIRERLAGCNADWAAHFLLSDRAIDARLAEAEGLAYTALPAQPLGKQPRGAWRFARGYRAAKAQVRRLIEQCNARALVATGGFVAGPAAAAATQAGVPVALVNLDATPGLANRLIARRASALFTVYPSDRLSGARPIGLPVRDAARAGLSAADARRELGLDPHTPTLLVTAGSQGARTINAMMQAAMDRPAMQAALQGWQVLHLAGSDETGPIQTAYAHAGVAGRVPAYLKQMGLGWAAASLAISRAGAGSVGEVWANHVPTLFLPYPYHRDQHQRHNAQPLVDSGGAILGIDHIDAAANAAALAEAIEPLLRQSDRLSGMADRLRDSAPPDGAAAVAEWLCEAKTNAGAPFA